MTSNNRILTDAELNGVSGGLTNGDNPFVQAVMNAYNTYDNPNQAIDPRCGFLSTKNCEYDQPFHHGHAS